MDNLKQKALLYLSKGLPIFPVGVDKKPVISSWFKYQTELPTSKEVEEWFSRPSAVGIAMATGWLSGVSVIDIDRNKDTGELPKIQLPPTFIVNTGGGEGRHHNYYKYNALADGLAHIKLNVDVRSQGNYVIIPPSLHASGNRYEGASMSFSAVDFARDLNPFPTYLLPDTAQKTEGLFDDLGFRKSFESRFHREVPEGERNSTAISFCGSLLSQITIPLWDAMIPDKLEDWNEEYCSPPLPQAELLTCYRQAKSMQTENPSGINTPEPTELELEESLESLTLSVMMKLETPDNPYIVDVLVPTGTIVSIIGETGKGKSLFMLELAKSMAFGEDFFGEFVVEDKQRVLIIDQEMNKNLLVDRFKSFFYDKTETEMKSSGLEIMFEKCWSIDDPKKFKAMKKKIVKGKYDVVIFDTWITIHGAEENSSDSVKKINALMLEMIAECGITIIYLHHKKKAMDGGSSTGANSARGSTEILAKVSSNIEIHSKEDMDEDGVNMKVMTITQSKNRLAQALPKSEVWVYYDPITKRTRWDYKGGVGSKPKVLEVATDHLKEYYGGLERGETKTFSDVLESFKESGVKVGQKNLRKAIKELVTDGVLLEIPYGTGKTYGMEGTAMTSALYDKLGDE